VIVAVFRHAIRHAAIPNAGDLMDMNDEVFSIEQVSSRKRGLSLNDVATVAFRRRRLSLICGLLTIVAALFAAFVMPRYHAESKVLVQRERLDPLLSPTPETNNFSVAAQPIVTDEDLRSEVELMGSTDVLQQVVQDLDLIHQPSHSRFGWLTGWMNRWKSDDERVSLSVKQLRKDMLIEPVKGSYIISVVYKSKDRAAAKKVLSKLLDVYLAKHTAVHRTSGQFAFFDQQTADFQKQMEDAKGKLQEFTRDGNGTVSPVMDRDLTMQKLAEFKSSLQQTRASIADAEHRIQDLDQQAAKVPARITTQSRRADNPQLMQDMKATLLNLELKRLDLLNQYQPSYRPVVELEKQIAEAKAEIEREEKTPLRDETTDLDPTHELLRTERAKAMADLAGFQARERATEETVRLYEGRAKNLDTIGLNQADLLRNYKTAEESYLLYLHKREEARITDALDAKRMVNVSVAEAPLVPAIPAHSPLFMGVFAFLCMLVSSVGLIGGVERLDKTLHSTRDIERYLDIPVLGALPEQGTQGAH
jgi:polysaccharide biosynthesis protein PslE